MKIRHGWVSNSSTSSFVGIGWKFDSDNYGVIKKLCKYAGTNYDLTFKKLKEDPFSCDSYDLFEELLQQLDEKNKAEIKFSNEQTEYGECYLYYDIEQKLDSCRRKEEFIENFNDVVNGIDDDLIDLLGYPTFIADTIES